jgi:hypothetical protein
MECQHDRRIGLPASVIPEVMIAFQRPLDNCG